MNTRMIYKVSASVAALATVLLSSGVVAENAERGVVVENAVNTSSRQQSFSSKGFIYGYVWNDVDEDGRRDFRERGLRRTTVYLDANDNGVRDADERFRRTGLGGFYFFSGLEAQEYVVRQELDFGWRNISGGEGDITVPQQSERSSANQGGAVTAQVIGGDEVGIEEYPFMVALGRITAGQFRQFCGAVLISDRWVASAAHCLERVDPSAVGILAGTNNVDDGSGIVATVKAITLHPDYTLRPLPGEPVPNSFGTGAGYDIAVLELDEPIDLEASGLQSVSMLTPKNAALAATDVLATIVGWGVTDLPSNLLQDVHAPIFDTQVCNDVYSSSTNFETQICAGAPEGGIDACQGDSGGPLLVRDFSRDKWKVAGFTSYGNGCALPGNPGVWSRASVLSDWAKDTARETSRVHRIDLTGGGLRFAEFGNIGTRYQPAEEIDPRWQLVNAVVTGDETVGFGLDYRIIDEAERPRTFSCTIDPDAQGPMPASSLPCDVGANQFNLPTYDTGVFVPTLAAELDGTDFMRRSPGLLVGSPPEESVSGELTEEDEIDPDFVSEYYIDYFDLKDIVGDEARLVRVEPTGFDAFVALYDRDVRVANGGFGVLETYTSDFFQGPLEFILFADPNVNYLLGISTFFPLEVGSYTITVVNGGSAEATTLSVPLDPTTRSGRSAGKERAPVAPPLRP